MVHARNSIGLILVLLSIAFLGHSYIQSENPITKEQLTRLSSWGLIWGVLLFLISNIVSAASWQRLTDPKRNHIRTLPSAAAIWMISNTGKYLPGNVIHYISRYRYATQSGVGSIEATTAMLVEVFTVSFAALLLTVPSFLMSPTETHDRVWQAINFEKITLLIVSLLVAVSMVLIVISQYRPDIVQRVSLIGLRMQKHLIVSASAWLQALALCMLSFLLAAGAACVNLQLIQTPDIQVSFSLLLGAYSLAFLAGYVVPGAPGGIGIREAAMFAMLAPSVGEANAILLAISLRVCSVVADFSGAILAGTFIKVPYVQGQR